MAVHRLLCGEKRELSDEGEQVLCIKLSDNIKRWKISIHTSKLRHISVSLWCRIRSAKDSPSTGVRGRGGGDKPRKFLTKAKLASPTPTASVSLIFRLAEFSNVTEYVICIFTFSSAHNGEEEQVGGRGGEGKKCSTAARTFLWALLRASLDFIRRTRVEISGGRGVWSVESFHCRDPLLPPRHTSIYSYIKGKNPQKHERMVSTVTRCVTSPEEAREEHKEERDGRNR